MRTSNLLCTSNRFTNCLRNQRRVLRRLNSLHQFVKELKKFEMCLSKPNLRLANRFTLIMRAFNGGASRDRTDDI